MNEWICSNLHADIITYVTDSQVHTTNNTRKATNELMNQAMKIDGIQYYNKYQESMLLNLFTEDNIYTNSSYASCVDWRIEKTPEAHPKKFKFNVNKPETNLKKID